ncbi:MAG: tetratricopeptide repeat protein [Planctomycetota bacterium]
MDTHAQFLLDRGRYDEAADKLRAALAQRPDDAISHAMLGLCLIELKRLAEAEQEIGTAISLAPDHPYPHHLLAYASIKRGKLADAAESADEAIRLDPHSATHYFMRAQVEASAERWQNCVDWCDQGLALDPENDDLINLRATALTRLGRRDEADASVGQALRQSPDNPWAHANLGWSLLHRNQTKQALGHFQEALRLDPGFDWAKAGLVEALKARNPIYRALLAWFLWMARLSPRTRMVILIGGYIAYRILGGVAGANPELAPFLWPLLGLYIAFAVLTWTVQPLFDLTLLTHPAGRYALTGRQLRAAIAFGLLLLAAFALAGTGLGIGSGTILLAALYTGIAAVVWGTALGEVPEHRTWVYLAAATIVTGLGVAVVAGAATEAAWFGTSLTLFIVAFLGFQFLPATPLGR